jgi:hypothetical protein
VEAQTYKLHLKPGKNRIFIDSVSINGKPVSGVFVFDTGSGETVIFSESALSSSLSYKKKWKLQRYSNTYYGKKKTSYGQFSEIQIGELKLKNVEIGIMDWEEFNNPCFENRIIGVIGLDIIKKYHWFFDLKNQTGYASEEPVNNEGYNYFDLKKSFSKLYVYTDKTFLKNNPFQKSKYLLDTGNPSSVVIRYEDGKNWKKLPKGVQISMEFSNVITKSLFYPDEVNLNNTNYIKQIQYSSNAKTTLGLGFFQQTKIIIPKGLRKIYYTDLAADTPLYVSKTGFNITKKKNNDIKVYVLYKDSPAERSGLKLGDVILQINNKNLSDIDCLKLNYFMKEESEKDKMILKLKNGKIITLLLN